MRLQTCGPPFRRSPTPRPNTAALSREATGLRRTRGRREPIPGPTTERFQALAKELNLVIVLPIYEVANAGENRARQSWHFLAHATIIAYASLCARKSVNPVFGIVGAALARGRRNDES
jgi:hypothetical protein